MRQRILNSGYYLRSMYQTRPSNYLRCIQYFSCILRYISQHTTRRSKVQRQQPKTHQSFSKQSKFLSTLASSRVTPNQALKLRGKNGVIA